MIAKHFNQEYDAGDGFPKNIGDRYYSQDMARDWYYMMDRIGLLAKDLIGELPLIVSGGVVSKGGSANEINITPCIGYVEFEVDVPDSYAALPPTDAQEDIDMIRTVSTQQTNLDILATATLDGSTTNYVKLNYAEADGASRSRAKKAGSYAYDQSPSFAIVVDDTAPTDKDVCLLAFTWDGVLANVLEKIGGQRSPMLLDLLAVKGKYPENDIINGSFDFWQRGTSFATITDGTYSADRFVYGKVGAMVHTVSRSTDVPGSSPFDINYSMLVDCTTVDAAIAAGDFCIISQKIEGYNFKKYVGGVGTLSFWVKGTKVGVHCVSFRNSVADRSYVVEYAINVTNTWEYKVITIPLDYSGGTWDYVNGIGLEISWALACGTDFHGVADTWNSADDLATSNQVNACDNTANNFRLAKVKFELGQVATPFVAIDQEQGFAQCQRYYEKSYNRDVDPGTATITGYVSFESNGFNASAHDLKVPLTFKVKKRITASTVTLYAPDGTINEVSMLGGNKAGSSAAVGDSSFIGQGATLDVTAQRFIRFQWISDAEL